MPLRDEDVNYEPSLLYNAVPRSKHDDFAKRFQNKILESNAAVQALRNYPRNAPMVQDSDTPVEFVQSLGGDTLGKYNRKTNKVQIASVGDRSNLQETLYHELLHGLQAQGHPGAASDSPLQATSTMRNRVYMDKDFPGHGTSEQFYDAMKKAGMVYGPGEAAAWMAANLNQDVPMHPSVREVAAQYPGIAGVFAGKVSQPNRPAPIHSKGYPELGPLGKLGYHLGIPPEISMEDRLNAARVQILRKINEQTNPRERR